MFDFFERGFLATVGMMSLTRERSQELVEEMVRRGELSREEGMDIIERMVRRGEEEQGRLREMVRTEVKSVLNELHMVTKDDLQALNDKLDALLAKLEET